MHHEQGALGYAIGREHVYATAADMLAQDGNMAERGMGHLHYCEALLRQRSCGGLLAPHQNKGFLPPASSPISSQS